MAGGLGYDGGALLGLQLRRSWVLQLIAGPGVVLPQGRRVATGVSRFLLRESFLAGHAILTQMETATPCASLDVSPRDFCIV
jgi:hypothetical protein